MLLVSDALTEQGHPVVTALNVSIEGGHAQAEALFIQGVSPAGPLRCTLHTSATSSESVIIHWPGYTPNEAAAKGVSFKVLPEES